MVSSKKSTAQQSLPKKKVPAAASRDGRPTDEDAAQPRDAVGSRDRRPLDEDTARPRDAVGSRDRRPSDKVAAQLEAQQEMEKLKADKEERRTLRKKKAHQKAKQDAGMATESEDEFQPRANPTFTSHEVVTKVSLGQRTSKVPPPRTSSASSQPGQPLTEYEDNQNVRRPPSRGRAAHSPSPSVDDDDHDDHQVAPRAALVPEALEDPTRSSSPQAGSKRSHYSDHDEENDSGKEEADVHISKALKIEKKTARPKAGDYDDFGKELVLAAANIYRALLASQGAFPDHSTELKLIKKSWKMVNTERGVEPLTLTPSIVTIIKARGSQLRGEAKTKTAALVEALYGFDSGRSKRAIAENRRIAEGLKDDKGFVFAVLSDDEGNLKRKGIYNHPIIQKAVNKMWFKNKRDEGIMYSEYFNPVSIHSIALILTAIECNIEEWATGIKIDITFWAEEYRGMYESHVVSLSEFGEYSKSKDLDLLGRLQRRLYNYGRLHAGVPTLPPQTRHAIPFSAFVDAVEEYVDDDETDSEGSMRDA